MRCLKNLYKNVLSHSKWLQLFHQLFVGQGFRREILSVYAGVRAHRELESSTSGRIYRLRRNIHRIEKGLIMSPRRDVYGLDYIGDTISVYSEVISLCDVDESELKWFHDVLHKYFEVTATHPIIDAARELFNGYSVEHSGGLASIPRSRSEYKLSNISYEEFYTLCQQRRSVRWYQDKSVPRDLVDKAILAAAQSPSACNRQPFEFRIFDEQDLVEKVAAIPGGTTGFTHQFKMIVVLVGKLSAYEYDRDRHLIYIDGSLAAMSFMFALETLGLSSCSINWPGVEHLECQMDEALGLEPHERPLMLISVGYAKGSGQIPYSHKKCLDELRRYN